MAERGGTSPARSGTGQPSCSRSAALASQLYSDRSQDSRRRERESDDLQGSDSLEETLPSPLDLPDQSYAANDNASRWPANDNAAEEGPAMQSSALGEINKQSRQQAGMLATAAQFTGTSRGTTSGRDEELSSDMEEDTSSRRQGRRTAAEDAANDEEEENATATLVAAYQRAVQTSQREKQKLEADSPQAQQIQAHVKEAAKAWKAAKFGTAVTVVGLLVTLLIMNLQLINQISFKSSIIPRLSLPELMVTLVVDILFMALFIIQIWLFFGLPGMIFDAI
jgi:hypothetical protein